MPPEVPRVRRYADPESRFSIHLPPNWHLVEQRTGVSRSLLFRSPAKPGTAVALSFTAVPPGTEAADLLAYRRAAEGGGREANEASERRVGSVHLVGARWREGSSSSALEVEEACAVVGACAVLLRAQSPVADLKARALVEEVVRSLELAGRQPAPAADPPTPQATRPAYHVRETVVEIACELSPPLMEVACTLELEPAVSPPTPLHLMLPPYPLARVRRVRMAGAEDAVPFTLGHERGAQVVEVSPDALPPPGRALTLDYRLHFGWGDPGQHRAHGIYWAPSELVCMGSSWMPRPRGGRHEAAPYALDLSVPAELHLVSGGLLSHRHQDAERIQVRYSGTARDVAFSLRRTPPAFHEACGTSRTSVTVSGGPAPTPRQEIANTLSEAATLMERWVAPAPQARELHVVFYSGETSHGFGSLLLVGRTFQIAGVPLDRRWMGQSTLRETLLHELCHLWFGGLLHGAGEDPDQPQEALAGFFTLRLVEALLGSKAKAASREALLRQYRAASALRTDGIPRQFRSRFQAVEGALTLDGLRDLVGAEAFDGSMRSYVSHRIAEDRSFSVEGVLDTLEHETGASTRALLDTLEWRSAQEVSRPREG